MKIVLVTEYFPSARSIITGGVERRVARIAQLLAKYHTVTVLAANTVERGQREVAGLRVVRCGQKRTYTSRGSLLTRLHMLLDMFQKGKTLECDIVEASNATVYLAGFFIGLAVKAKRVAWVPDVFGRNLLGSLGVISGIAALLMERVGLLLPWDHYIALSRQTEMKLRRLGVAGKKISVVYGGVDVDVERAKPASYEQILTVSRLVPYKRVEDIIAAMRLVKQKVPSARLRIVGDGSQRERLVCMAREGGVGDCVQFIAHVTDAKLQTVMSKAAVYCSASTVEGFGLSVMEAMARGIPAVIPDIKIHREVNTGKGVLYFRPQDHRDLADKLIRLLTEKNLWEKRSREARDLASRYSWPLIAAHTLGVYNKTIKRK